MLCLPPDCKNSVRCSINKPKILFTVYRENLMRAILVVSNIKSVGILGRF